MRKVTCFLAIVLFFISVNIVNAQTKHVENRDQFWLGYFNQARFSNRWGSWFDIHFRTNNFLTPSMTFVRPGIVYYLKDNLRLMAGYAFVYNFAPDGKNTNWHEHRPWQQIWWRQDYSGYQTLQWLRLEERYIQKVVNDQLTGDYSFNYRLRYNFLLNVPLIGKEMKRPKTPFFVVQDEIFINFGEQIVYNYFDQNRFFIGLGYVVNPHLNFNIGYMNVFQQLPSGNNFYSSHCLRLFVYHTLDFRKNKN